ncbi:esterase-like activity of phytase family protein [Rhabdaerophilum calidifontis]|uniref:esterase-like activity of phytase family protein n=1 Tax=Rhabdaerophilum calidifontis TaxID=2604328 RepID=UPI0012399F89|nr:esterase-like activity of phytase family protein [Rhabdaerophilum calidifontis]
MRREIAVPAPRLTGIRARRALAAGFAGLCLCAARAQDTPPPETPPLRALATPIQIANLPLGVVTFPNGKAINLSVAMGSAAFRQPGDAQGRIWLLTDRGPAIACEEAKRVIGLEPEQICNGDRGGRINPLPGFVPSIYGVDIGTDNVARINVFIPLKGRSGKPVSGRPGPISPPGRPEPVYGIDGKPLPLDPSGVDPEGFARLQDGTFWIAEEFGPSLLEVGPDGAIRRRLVPAGAQADFKDADYEIFPVLPAILRQRLPGRGLEGLALAPDERHLFVAMQSPLANPDPDAARASRHVRIWKIERETGRVAGQYLYELDEASAFRADAELARDRNQLQAGITEIVALAENRLLIVERIDRTARLFTVELGDSALVPPDLDLPETRPTLEQLGREVLRERGLSPLAKELVLDTDTIPGLPGRIEAVAVTAQDEVIIVNDNDFAIDGVRTQMFRVTLPRPVLR